MRTGVWRRVVLGSAALIGFGLVAAVVLTPDPGATVDDAPDCGPPVAKPTGGTWTCTFADDFSASSLDRDTWTVQETATSGYRNGGDCFIDAVDTVTVGGGMRR
jgi:hypothetical protein